MTTATDRVHIHRDDAPQTLRLLLAITRDREPERLGYERTKEGIWVDWDQMLGSFLSSTEKGAVHIARGCATIERQGGLSPLLAKVALETVEAVV